MRQQIDAKRVLIEKEFSFKGISYEIYYFDEKNRLIKKIKNPISFLSLYLVLLIFSYTLIKCTFYSMIHVVSDVNRY